MSPILENQEISKRPKRRLGRLWKKLWRQFWLFSSLVGLFLVGFGIWMGVGQGRTFSLQKIEVVGDLKQLNMHEIIESSKAPLGVNIFKISLKMVEQNVARLPWVASVSVRRQAPSTLWIHVREKKPRALLFADRLYFVSEEGEVFKAVEQESCRDLPVLTGFEKKDSLGQAMQLINFFEGSSDFELFGLSEIHYNDAIGFSIVTLLGPMEVRLGRGDFEGKLARLKTVWSGLSQTLGPVKGIDLDYEDKAFVKL